MNQIKLTALLFVFFLIPINVSAVEINECEDEEGNRSFQKKCPPGSTSVNKTNYATRGSDPTSAQSKPVSVVLYLKLDCRTCDQVKEFLTVNNIPMTEKNVTDNDEIREELVITTGINAGVPVLIVGDQLIRGFDNIRMASLLRDAGYPVTIQQAP